MHRFLFCVALLLCAPYANATEALAKFNIVLMQPQELLQARVPSVPSLAAYIEALEAKANGAVAVAKSRQAASGFIVVAVRPGQRSNIWLDFEPSLPPELQEGITKQLRSVLPMRVQDGPVVFALKVGLWGGAEATRVSPSPSEWKVAASKAGRPLEVGELVEMIWRD